METGLPVGTEVGQHAVAAGGGEVLRQPMRGMDRQRHQRGGVVAGVAEHEPLVAGAEEGEVLGGRVAARLEGGVHALGDVRGLGADGDLHAAGVRVEALLGGVVADLADHVAHDRRHVAVPGGAHLARHVHEARGDHGLDRHARTGVLGEQVVEDRVGDLVADLVGMPPGDRFGREGAQLAGGHGISVLAGADRRARRAPCGRPGSCCPRPRRSPPRRGPGSAPRSRSRRTRRRRRH